MELPLELLEIVAQNLLKVNIKQLRLVNKALAERLAPSLYTSIFLSPDPLDLEHAEDALPRFKNFIKTIVISPLKYRKLTQQQYKFRVEIAIKCHPLSPLSRFEEHIQMGHRMYLAQERAQNWTKDQLKELFQRVLRDAPNVRKVIITYRHRYTDMRGSELAKYCCWSDCILTRDTHKAFRFLPSLRASHSSGSNIINSILAIMPAGTKKISNLVMDPAKGVREGTLRIPLAGFDRPD